MKFTSTFIAISSLWALAVAQSTTTITVTVTVAPTGTTTVTPTATVLPTPTVTPSTTTTTVTVPPIATPSPPAFNTTVSYDTLYDNRSGSIASVACSDGSHGLLTKGFSTFGSLPNYPLIGGAFSITGWNSASCGTCWELAYTNAGVTTKVNVLALDVALNSFNIALGGLNQLTGGRGQQLGRVNVQARQVDVSLCKL